jgi:hypothetical protein
MAAPLQRRLRIILLVLLLGLTAPEPSWADDGQASAVPASTKVESPAGTARSLAGKGPLEGKNFSPHYLIFFNLPGISARPPAGVRYALGLSTYLSQEFLASYEGSGR